MGTSPCKTNAFSKCPSGQKEDEAYNVRPNPGKLNATFFMPLLTMNKTAPLPSSLSELPQMYAIALENGPSHSRNTSILNVTHDYDAGQRWVDNMNALYTSLLGKRHLLAQALLEREAQDPMPASTPVDLIPQIIELNPGSPTQAEREERHRINNENFLRNLQSREPLRQWNNRVTAFTTAWLRENLTPQEARLNDSQEEYVWSMHPVPWLDPDDMTS